jgi:hypothetical protein
MEFIVVFDPDQKNACIMESSNYFLETFSSYENARQEAEIWKTNNDCESFGIYVRCSDERNHLV